MRRSALLLSLLAVLLTGCATSSEPTYGVYFADRSAGFGEGALTAEERTLPRDLPSVEPEIEGLLQLLLQGPMGEGLTSPIPSGTTLLGWQLEEGVLTVDFSWRYGSLSGVDLTLADYSVALTLEQLDQVDQVDILVEGEEISYRGSPQIRGEDALLSIFRGEPVERVVTLYFPRQEGDRLEREERTLAVSQEESLAAALLEALALGPQDQESRGVISQGEVLSVEVREGVCYLDLAATFPELAAEDGSVDRATLYSLVNTLCQLETVSAVRFLCEGEAMTRYGAVTITEPLQEDLSLLGSLG